MMMRGIKATRNDHQINSDFLPTGAFAKKTGLHSNFDFLGMAVNG